MEQQLWWRMPKNAHGAASAIWQTIGRQAHWKQIEQRDIYALEWLYNRERLMSRYGSVEGALSVGPNTLSQDLKWLITEEKLGIPSANILRGAIDTIVNWLFSEQSPIGISSAGVPFEMRFSIEDYESALDTLHNTEDARQHLEMAARNAALTGTGIAWPVYQNGKISVRRLMSWQVIVDPVEARNGKPTTAHVVDHVDRDSLIAWLNKWEGIQGKTKKLKAIRKMEADMRMHLPGQGGAMSTVYDYELGAGQIYSDADRLFVVHSYRHATRADADDGRYLMCVYGADKSAGVCVIDETFKRTTLPMAFFQPLPADEGVGGTGFGHLMRGWQEALDRSMFKIQRAMDKWGHIKVLVRGDPKTSQINVKAWLKSGVEVIFVPGPAVGEPQFIDPHVIREEDLLWISRILELSQSIHGINQLMARGTSALGAGASGVAQQEEFFRTLDRFTTLVSQYLRFRLRIAEETLHLLDWVLTFDKEYAAKYEWQGHKRVRTWAELQEQLRGITIQLEPRGSAAQSRAGRTARIQEWGGQGLIDQATAQEALLTTPDVRRAAKLATAGQRLVEWQIRRIIEARDDEDLSNAMPDKDTPHAIAIDRATKYIQLGRTEGAEPETLERLRLYKMAAEKLLKEMQAEILQQQYLSQRAAKGWQTDAFSAPGGSAPITMEDEVAAAMPADPAAVPTL